MNLGRPPTSYYHYNCKNHRIKNDLTSVAQYRPSSSGDWTSESDWAASKLLLGRNLLIGVDALQSHHRFLLQFEVEGSSSRPFVSPICWQMIERNGRILKIKKKSAVATLFETWKPLHYHVRDSVVLPAASAQRTGCQDSETGRAYKCHYSAYHQCPFQTQPSVAYEKRNLINSREFRIKNAKNETNISNWSIRISCSKNCKRPMKPLQPRVKMSRTKRKSIKTKSLPFPRAC